MMVWTSPARHLAHRSAVHGKVHHRFVLYHDRWLDLAKHVFQVHGVGGSGRVVVAKAVRRKHLLEFFASLPSCLVGLEASGSARHWARELITLGHEVRMMPPAYVKPYIRRQKNDASDAAAICEAVTRPTMRFVGVRTLENQAALMRHKTREMLVSQRTQLFNGLRGHLTEVSVISAQGPRHARELAELIEACDETIPFEVCEALAPLDVDQKRLRQEQVSKPARAPRSRSRCRCSVKPESRAPYFAARSPLLGFLAMNAIRMSWEMLRACIF
jgi:transposase